jgi:hypothetical protein
MFAPIKPIKPMMKLLRVFSALFIILITACSEEKKSKLTFTNDIESSYWSSSAGVMVFPNAHSGNYVSKLNKESAYSTIFNIKVKDIPDHASQRIKISAWFMLTGNDSEQNLVLDVRDSSMQNSLEWINVDARDYVTDLNTWGKTELIVDLTQKSRNSPENVLRIYAANGKETPVYVDDFEIEFEK